MNDGMFEYELDEAVLDEAQAQEEISRMEEGFKAWQDDFIEEDAREVARRFSTYEEDESSLCYW